MVGIGVITQRQGAIKDLTDDDCPLQRLGAHLAQAAQPLGVGVDPAVGEFGGIADVAMHLAGGLVAGLARRDGHALSRDLVLTFEFLLLLGDLLSPPAAYRLAIGTLTIDALAVFVGLGLAGFMLPRGRAVGLLRQAGQRFGATALPISLFTLGDRGRARGGRRGGLALLRFATTAGQFLQLTSATLSHRLGAFLTLFRRTRARLAG